MEHDGTDKLRVGVINLMPDTVAYHEEFSRALQCVAHRVELCWLRLATRSYAPEALSFVEERYRLFADAMAERPLDGLIVTGAPLELVEFTEVSYWGELSGIVNRAVREKMHTFGICWGALAVGNVLGLRKTVLPAKVSGVYPALNVAGEGSPLSSLPRELELPFSIQAHFHADDVLRQRHEGKLILAATIEAIAHPFVHTADGRHFMCLGHPEYGPNRLVAEFHRDIKKNPATPPPFRVDLGSPQEQWRAAANGLFVAWVDQIAGRALGLGRACTQARQAERRTS